MINRVIITFIVLDYLLLNHQNDFYYFSNCLYYYLESLQEDHLSYFLFPFHISFLIKFIHAFYFFVKLIFH
jgi:hypothetical protein